VWNTVGVIASQMLSLSRFSSSHRGSYGIVVYRVRQETETNHESHMCTAYTCSANFCMTLFNLQNEALVKKGWLQGHHSICAPDKLAVCRGPLVHTVRPAATQRARTNKQTNKQNIHKASHHSKHNKNLAQYQRYAAANEGILR
jgi:hypothetical protein